MKLRILLAACVVLLCCTAASASQIAKIKDIAQIEGARNNQLVGYGLVVGLDGSGDSQQAVFTIQSVANMLQKFGISVPANKIKVKNAAAVMITANLPPFLRPGSRIDVLVSSIGDAKSLQGGTLLQAPLQGADGGVYAVAQGSISVGGFAAGGSGASVTKNHTTAGRIPGGAIIEQAVASSLVSDNSVNVMLNSPDFTNAASIACAINDEFGGQTASALDAGTVRVSVDDRDIVGLIARIGELSVAQATTARVIVNERTGTVVIGGDVRLEPVAISHGNLSVEIASRTGVSQPPPLSPGETTAVTEEMTVTREQDSRLMYVKPTATLDELVRALNELKVTPRDIIAILQALKEAGALHAVLEII